MTVKGQAPCLAVAPSWSSGALEELPPRRREVTLLVSDLAGLGDDEGWWRPDGLAEIVDHYLRDVVRIAGDSAGIVPSLLGTRLWIIFGAFVDRDDAPVAA